MTPYLQDTDLTVYQGDALATLRELPSESVHCCITSPPFFGLRDYGVEGQIGLEASPKEWCDSLVAVFREVRRVLRPDGTLWVEVGDSYTAGQGGRQTAAGEMPRKVLRQDAAPWNGQKGTTTKFTPGRGVTDLKPKDLVGAPWLLAFALRADGWYLRSDIIWARPNPMPESVTDRPTKSHSYLFLLSKSARYFYDADAIREPATHGERFHGGYEASHNGYASRNGRDGTPNLTTARNKRSVWTIPTQPLADEHYAAYPEALVEPCILAGTSERGVCPECGAPWVRETEAVAENVRAPGDNGPHHRPAPVRAGSDARSDAMAAGGFVAGRSTLRKTTGWRPTCDHDLEPVTATVLDPFLGSGTTALVARRLGRRCVGVELNETYCRMIARRTQQLSLVAEATA